MWELDDSACKMHLNSPATTHICSQDESCLDGCGIVFFNEIKIYYHV